MHRNDLKHLQSMGGLMRRHKGQGLDEFSMAKRSNALTRNNDDWSSSLHAIKKLPNNAMYDMFRS
jgi:hypothetical protein